MIETPRVLSETPPSSTDLLSDLLSSMHLSGMVLFRSDFHEPWAVTTPDACQLAKELPMRADHVIPFHVISAGECCLELPDHDPIWVREGDVVLIPYGASHLLRGREAASSIPVAQLLPEHLPTNKLCLINHGGAGETTSIICGFLQCDELLFHPIVRHLPALLHIRPDSTPADSWLASTIRHTIIEASQPKPGSHSMLPRLTEIMFVEILRKYMQGMSADAVGWFAALNDPVVGAALKYMHASPFYSWSVDGLARQVGVSRTVLAERFKHFLDQPPMQYLSGWRLQLAAQQLKSSDLPLKVIVEQSGYESEAAFSKAFKRHFGLPPGHWRKRQG